MRDLTKTEEFFPFMAEAIGPICTIFDDPEVIGKQNAGAPFHEIYALLFRKHSDSLIRLVAAAQGVSTEEFRSNFNPALFPDQLSEVLANPVVRSFFTSAEQKTPVTSSGSAQANGTV